LGLLIGLTAMAYQLLTGRSFTQVLFSGENDLPDLVSHAADYSLVVLVVLIVCKAITYVLSLSAFRGGPVSRHSSSAERSVSRPAGCLAWISPPQLA
jgi:hypothetical protein